VQTSFDRSNPQRAELEQALLAVPGALRRIARGTIDQRSIDSGTLILELCVALHEARLRRAIHILFLLSIQQPSGRKAGIQVKWKAALCHQARRYLNEVVAIAGDARTTRTWRSFCRAKLPLKRRPRAKC
jgi:hypothetical protein